MPQPSQGAESLLHADGTTPLHQAAHRDDLEAVDRLIRLGADVRAVNRYGITPLWLACENGNSVIAERLLKAGADSNASRLDSGETPLMVAARGGAIDTMKVLLAHGANINATETVRGQTALMWAAAEQQPVITKFLLDARADLNIKSAFGMTAIMFAVRAGDIESTRHLLEAGANVRELAASGSSLMTVAMINLRFRLATFLLERGADPNMADDHAPPLHLLGLIRRGDNRGLGDVIPRTPIRTEMDGLDFARELLKHGASVNLRLTKLAGTRRTAVKDVAIGTYGIPLSGATPFLVAALTNDVPYMRLLIAHGADPSIATEQNVTPLLAAAGAGFREGEHPGTPAEVYESVRLAAALGNDPKALGNGYTAIHLAAARGAEEAVGWLAEQGVPLDVKNPRGNTAWDLANGAEITAGANTWPTTAALIERLLAERGLPPPVVRDPIEPRRRR